MIQAMPSPVATLCRERRSIKGCAGSQVLNLISPLTSEDCGGSSCSKPCLQQVFQASTLTLNLEHAPVWFLFARCAYAASFPLGKGVCLQERPNLSFNGKDRATGFGFSHVPASSQVVSIF